MRGARATLIAILLVGTAAAAAAGDMVLTRNGELYRVGPSDEGLVVTHRFADGTTADYLIPQTSGIVASSVQVGVDEQTGAIFVAWQQGEDAQAAIEIAWLADQWWAGPVIVAGRDGNTVENPQLILDRVVSVVDDDDGPIEVATTFLHLVWWSYADDPEDGSAYLASVEIDTQGNPKLDDFSPIALSDLLPYGVGCQGIINAEGLAHPMIFQDPQSGAPHIFATDFSNCLFQILKINYELIEEVTGETKRRRHIVLLGQSSMIAANPDVILSSAKVEVGHGLALVMYWDVEDAIAYVQLDENGVPPIQTLGYGNALTREQAIDMVRSLVH